MCAQTLRWHTHYIYSLCNYLLIIREIVFPSEPCCQAGAQQLLQVNDESNLRFIPKGYDVSGEVQICIVNGLVSSADVHLKLKMRSSSMNTVFISSTKFICHYR